MTNLTVDDLAKEILTNVVADFRAKNLGATDLSNEYVGVSLPSLESTLCVGGSHSKVDFDLALKQLEEGELVKTGPLVPYENEPGSQVFIFAAFSKREFAYLTEKGYKAAQKLPRKTRSAVPSVHISGGDVSSNSNRSWNHCQPNREPQPRQRFRSHRTPREPTQPARLIS